MSDTGDTGDAAIFLLDGDLVVPTPLAEGPWDAGAQHGGAVAGLLARTVERTPTPVPMRVARFTLDLLRRVPLEPLACTTEVVRTGKRVQVTVARLHADGQLVASATALSVRVGADLDLSGRRQPDAPLPPPPREAGQQDDMRVRELIPRGFPTVVEFDRVTGGRSGGTPSKTWLRLTAPFVRGEPTSPLVRLMAMADFTSGLASFLPFEEYVSINPDLSVHVLRTPAGERIGIDAETWVDGDGIGQSRAKMFDHQGLCALSSATVFVDSREHYGGS